MSTKILGHSLGLAALWGGVVMPAWQFVASTAGVWYPAVAVLAGPLAGVLPLSGAAATTLLQAGSAVYVATLLDRFSDRLGL